MDEVSFSPNSELTAEDLAIIQAFDALEDLAYSENQNDPDALQGSGSALSFDNRGLPIESQEDMLILFASEADEDITTMKRALQQIEVDNQIGSQGLVFLGRAAHKLKGTSGAMGYDSMSAIALQIEEEIHLLKSEKIPFFAGFKALMRAAEALELTLQSVVEVGIESTQPLQQLLQDLANFNAEAVQGANNPDEEPESPLLHISPKENTDALPEIGVQVDKHRLRSLISHTQSLVEFHGPLQDAQRQVSQALLEVQTAHNRLKRLETIFSSSTFNNASLNISERPENASSPLVTRLRALSGGRLLPQNKSRSEPVSGSLVGKVTEQAVWDDMEVDRFTENRMLMQSFSEAVADVATASSQLNVAFTRLNALMDQQIKKGSAVRDDVLHLRSIPFSVLLTRVQRIVQMVSQTHNQPIHFEAAGENLDIDQEIFDVLGEPLLQLIRISVSESLLSLPQLAPNSQYGIWLQARCTSSETFIELGFSMPIPGGALEALREPINHLQGSMAAGRNASGGVSYQMRFPRAQGIIQGLLVQVGDQGFVLSLSHILAIDYKRQTTYNHIYNLASLLGFPATPHSPTPLEPLILLTNSPQSIGIQVDEIIGEIELVPRPLPPHLQRPGVVNSALDSSGNILLLLDIHALIQHGTSQHNKPLTLDLADEQGELAGVTSTQNNASVTLLIADDSLSIRLSLRKTFERAGYHVVEARDGMEALEYLTSDQPPKILLLDIEMPNLNGYDLLNILHSQSDIIACKAILLTSRSSDRHRQRAMELGAYAFLGKPCPSEVLLETVRKALNDTSHQLF